MTGRLRHGAALVLAASMMATPAQASDFSQLAIPSIARLTLLTAQRQQQVDCAGLALHLSRTGRTVSTATATRLADGVGRRLGVDLGDAGRGQSTIEDRARGHSHPFKTNSEWVEIRRQLAATCAGLFGAAESGEAQLAAALGPIPTEPLRLPDGEQCLAVARYAEETGLAENGTEFAKLLVQARIDPASPAERASREATAAAGLDHLRAVKPDSDRLHLMMIACLPTIVEASRIVGPRPQATER